MRRTVLELLQKDPKLARERAAGSAPAGTAAHEPGRRLGSGRLQRFVEESLLYQTNVWVVMSSLVLFEQLSGVTKPPLVLAGFLFYSAGNLGKEAATVALALRSPWIAREVGRALDAGAARDPGSPEPRGAERQRT